MFHPSSFHLRHWRGGLSDIPEGMALELIHRMMRTKTWKKENGLVSDSLSI
jgi:hypothetical protein